MNTEDQAWRELQTHAAAQLRSGFADRVLRGAQGPTPAVWQQLQDYAATRLRPGFAARVLRAARSLPRVPTLFDQLALGAITITVCLLGALFMHAYSIRMEEQRNLARWQRLAAEFQDVDAIR